MPFTLCMEIFSVDRGQACRIGYQWHTHRQYRVWVVGVSSSGVQSLWTAPIDISIGGQTNLLTPTGTTTDSTPAFTWRPVDGAVHYDLWVNQVGGTSQIIRVQNLTATSFTPATALPTDTYRVWVRAISAASEISPWSVMVEFRIAASDSESPFADLQLAVADPLLPRQIRMFQHPQAETPADAAIEACDAPRDPHDTFSPDHPKSIRSGHQATTVGAATAADRVITAVEDPGQLFPAAHDAVFVAWPCRGVEQL